MGTIFGLGRGVTALLGLLRELGLDQLPRGIVPPGVETVYAVAFDGGHGGADTPCDRCNPSGKGGGIYAMRSFDCVCASSPRSSD